jgi:RNA polymerase sigma factor (sigma-70 family)
MSDDSELLRCYATDRSEAAFAELVRRHLSLVYSAALRQVAGDTHLAEDIAQGVFTDLARKAALLADRPVLAGWLYTSTCYAAAKAVRTEQRRRAREQAAHAMQELNSDTTPPVDWNRLRPVIDAAMRDLGGRDREAILLRFFEGRGFADIGTRLQLSENAARMRVERALDKLHGLLARRGITSTAAALGAVLTTQAVTAAPAGLAATVTASALAGASAAGTTATFFTLMTTAKVQFGLGAAMVAVGAFTFVTQQQASARLQAEIDGLRTATAPLTQLREENRALARTAAEIESLRRDDAEFARLRDEAAALKIRHAGAAPSRWSTSAITGASDLTPTPGPVLSLANLDRLPTPISQAKPAYPTALRQFGIPGEATVTFVVDAKGHVRDVKTLKSTHSAFETAAAEAVKNWKFRPAEKGGAAVNVQISVPVVFSINTGTSKWF